MNHPRTDFDVSYMLLALDEGRNAAEKGEVPVGAVVVCEGEVIGRGHNQRETQQSPLAHAEILAIQEASSRLRNWRLSECDLYVTLEPCVMCVGTILQARIRRLVFGCLDAKAGAVESLFALCDDACWRARALICWRVSSKLYGKQKNHPVRRGGRARLKALDSKSSLPFG